MLGDDPELIQLDLSYARLITFALGLVAVKEEVVVREEPYINQFEKELKRIMK